MEENSNENCRIAGQSPIFTDGDWNSGSVDATKNNGNIVQQVITVPTVGASTGFVATQKYYYDSLNRIDDATEDLTPTGGSSTQTWRQDFSYDRYGNRNFVEANTTTIPRACGTSPSFTICTGDQKKFNPSINYSNKNQLDSSQGYAYDSSGNMTTDTDSRTFIYDGENKQVEVKDSGNNVIGDYFYDGDGKRVKKYVPDTSETTVFVYDAGGKQIAEYSSIVANSTDAKVAYLTNDNLGSPRINTDANGAVTARHDHHPFGDEIATSQRVAGVGYAEDTIRKHFTGYERDRETDTDFAQARSYSSVISRFSSVDPEIYGSAVEPQSFNKYAYCLNSPLVFTDSDGRHPTSLHDLIIALSFPALPPQETREIQRGSYSVDLPGAAFPSKANEHAMRTDANQSQTEAESNAAAFVSENVSKAQTTSGATSRFYYGRASHFGDDSTSIPHGPWIPFGHTDYLVAISPQGAVLRWAVESALHKQAEAYTNQTQINDAIWNQQALYRRTYGSDRFNRAVPSIFQFATYIFAIPSSINGNSRPIEIRARGDIANVTVRIDDDYNIVEIIKVEGRIPMEQPIPR